MNPFAQAMASAFGLVLVFNDLFSLEEAQSCRLGLLSSPVPEHSVWLGKGLAGLFLLLLSQAVFLPAAAVFLGQDIKGDWGVLLLALVVPLVQPLLGLGPVGLPDPVKWKDALGGTRDAAVDAARQGEVLFIDQRQLLTFGFITYVPLVPDYEKKYMMDLAMANDDAYFARFNQDLAAHRFKLIVSEELFTNYQGKNYTFGNENDAWVKYVSIPVLCYYQPSATYKGITQLLVPRDKPLPPRPGVTCP